MLCSLPLSLHPTAARLQESQQTQETATRALAEKDRTITQLQGRLDAMERECEKILHVSGDVAMGWLLLAGQFFLLTLLFPTRVAWTLYWPRWQRRASTGKS